MAKLRSDQLIRPASGITPISGAIQHPMNYSTGATGAPGNGNLFIEPFDIGPNSMTIQSIGVFCVVAYVAGSAVSTYNLALWPDDGTGGQPAWSSLLVQGTISPTAANANTFLTTSQTLTPGRWWAGFLYLQNGTAPTTPATFTCMQNPSPAVWITTASSIGTPARALRALSQTSIPTTAPTLSVTGSNDAPVIGLRRA